MFLLASVRVKKITQNCNQSINEASDVVTLMLGQFEAGIDEQRGTGLWEKDSAHLKCLSMFQLAPIVVMYSMNFFWFQ